MVKRHSWPDNAFIVLSILVLILLITLLTGIASNMITRTVSEQFRSQELQLVGTLARQMEFYLTILGGELENLASRPEVQSMSSVMRDAALALLQQSAARHADSIRAIVRLKDNGDPRYAWPSELNTRIREGQPLDWTLPASAVQLLINAGGIQFRPTPSPDGTVYLLIAPVEATSGRREWLVFELGMVSWLRETFGQIDLGDSGQLWVLDRSGRLIYQRADQPTWADTEQLSVPFLLAAQQPALLEYAAQDGLRQAAYAPARSFNTAFVVVLSRLVAESQTSVRQQVYVLFGMTVAAVLLVGVVATMFGRRVAYEGRRRHLEEQRRQVARTLLQVAQIVNASLDLDEVLKHILARLGDLVAHDTASIFLRTEEGLIAAAYKGPGEAVARRKVYSLDDLRAAGEVFQSGKPVVIGDCLIDPRWQPLPGSSIRSWLGVPLRVQGETVGVLNINSYRRFRFKPEDVEVAQLFAGQAVVAISNARLHEQRIRQYQEELEAAQAIQDSLLPREPICLPQVEVVGRSVAARTVSGDFFQFLPRLDGRLGVAIGDVTGKGMPAAILMAVMTTLLRRELDLQPTVADLLNVLNDGLIERLQSGHMHAALALAIFDPSTRRVEVANAGMLQPYLCTDRGEWQEISLSGYPLGASTQRRYTCKQFTLAPGAMLVFASDGLVEARNVVGEMFGFDRFEELLRALPRDLDGEGIAERVLQAIHRHLGGQEPQDDMTVVVMRSLDGLEAAQMWNKADTIPTRPSRAPGVGGDAA